MMGARLPQLQPATGVIPSYLGWKLPSAERTESWRLDDLHWPLFVMAVVLFASSTASAQCGQFFGQRVVVQHHAPAVVAVPQVSYFVGAPVRLEALVQQALRADPQYEEFRQWKLRAPQREAIKVEPDYPLLTAKCARCHSGDQPKGGVTLDGTRPVPAEVALTSLRFIRDRKGPDEMASVLAGLNDADLPALMQELLEVSK